MRPEFADLPSDLPSPLGRELDARDIDFIRRVSRRIVPFRVLDPDEAFGYGQIGYWRAVLAFDPSRRIPWPSYAYIRVRGAILDGARSWDWLSRDHRRAVRSGRVEHSAATNPPQSIEAMPMLSRSNEDCPNNYDPLERALWKGGQCPQVDTDDLATTLTLNSALEQVGQRDPRAAAICRMLYAQDMPISEVAEFFSVTPSRISQIRRDALDLLSDIIPPGVFVT